MALASRTVRLFSTPWFAATAAAAGAVGYQLQGQDGCAAADAPTYTGPLSPNEFRPLKLIEKKKISHNSYWLKFEYPGGNPWDLPVASCILTKASIQAPGEDAPKVVVRPYTPVIFPGSDTHLDLVVKSYAAGKMSKHIGNLEVGDTLDVKGPLPKYPYKPNAKKHIAMIAGGTGITPMLQVIEHILNNPADKTQISLIFANVSEKDILLASRLDHLARDHPEQFKIFYVVDKAKWGGTFWHGGVGYLRKDMVAAHIPPPAADNLVMVCGPPGMMKVVSGDKVSPSDQGEVTGILKELGWTKDNVYKF